MFNLYGQEGHKLTRSGPGFTAMSPYISMIRYNVRIINALVRINGLTFTDTDLVITVASTGDYFI